MRSHGTLLIAILGLGLGTVLAVPTTQAEDRAKIEQLITQLGSNNFRQREAAGKELDAIGEPTLEALRKATKSTDMEVANRATMLIAKIEQRAENVRLTAPTYVELTFKETPVDEAVAELSRKSGFMVVIVGDKTNRSGRNVTLETGKVPFWKALDMLCRKAELSEIDGSANQVLPLPRSQPPNNLKPAPVQPIPQGVLRPNVGQLPRNNGGTIILYDAKPTPLPTHINGAFRIRAANNANDAYGPVPTGEIGLFLDVRAEPKIQVQQILGVKIDKAIDDREQSLIPVLVSSSPLAPIDELQQLRQQRLQAMQVQMQMQIGRRMGARPYSVYDVFVGNQIVSTRLKRGEKESKTIAELRGTISMNIRTPIEDLVTIENVLAAQGETAKGKSGAVMKIIGVTKEDNGDIKVEVEAQYNNDIRPHIANTPTTGQPIRVQVVPGNNFQVLNAPVDNSTGVELVDIKGRSLSLLWRDIKFQSTVNGCSTIATLTFHPAKDQEAAKLVFRGTRLASVEVPFVLKDVPIK